jgi:hypothetical protein
MENFNKRKKPDFTADKCFYENFYKICSLKMKKELFLMTRSKANDKFIVEACKYPQKNRKGQLSHENICNYASFMYRTVTNEQQMVKFLRFHRGLLLSGDRSVDI